MTLSQICLSRATPTQGCSTLAPWIQCFNFPGLFEGLLCVKLPGDLRDVPGESQQEVDCPREGFCTHAPSGQWEHRNTKGILWSCSSLQHRLDWGLRRLLWAFTSIFLYKRCCYAWVWAQLGLPDSSPQHRASPVVEAPSQHHPVCWVVHTLCELCPTSIEHYPVCSGIV